MEIEYIDINVDQMDVCGMMDGQTANKAISMNNNLSLF